MQLVTYQATFMLKSFYTTSTLLYKSNRSGKPTLFLFLTPPFATAHAPFLSVNFAVNLGRSAFRSVSSQGRKRFSDLFSTTACKETPNRFELPRAGSRRCAVGVIISLTAKLLIYVLPANVFAEIYGLGKTQEGTMSGDELEPESLFILRLPSVSMCSRMNR